MPPKKIPPVTYTEEDLTAAVKGLSRISKVFNKACYLVELLLWSVVAWACLKVFNHPMTTTLANEVSVLLWRLGLLTGGVGLAMYMERFCKPVRTNVAEPLKELAKFRVETLLLSRR
eukprot:TRINITY_DN4881_c0_g4_i1.p2 TRINITY_DN4881_c0_g4~~TRINITY_DN4881_c0_g4_i1.p2  ORF type:complete len:117 (+),score=20.02 TRINITY_DN4881_c0_g4_i1:43-393(+)